eukprot:COSAG01_NODE_4176_length_5267_cov_34.739164_9_plen_113_part_00
MTSIKTTDGAEIVMERSENGTITVHVRNTQIGEDVISGLLKLISPDCCRHQTRAMIQIDTVRVSCAGRVANLVLAHVIALTALEFLIIFWIKVNKDLAMTRPMDFCQLSTEF